MFELERITYHEVDDAIRKRDPDRFKFTIETDPAYGKYHWTGHRLQSLPQDVMKFGNRYPVCPRKAH